MEVHTHTHTPRKKWTHYFWEFFMLFLAVTLGFFVENQREHYIEGKREKVYLEGILQDLKDDTTNFSSFLVRNNENYERFDSLIRETKTITSSTNTNRLYYLARTVWGKTERLQYIRRTYDQLKSSGSLRLIHKKNVLDSISRYFESLQWMDLQNELLIERQTLYAIELGEIFDSWTIDSIFSTDFSLPQSTPPLITTNKQQLNKYVAHLHAVKGVYNYNLKKISMEYLPAARKLIEILKDEYHLK